MDSDKSLWTLKQPVSIEDYDGGDLVEVDGHILLQSEIKELFQPLDVESLTTQLEDILQNFWQDEDQDLDDSVAEVLELIGITKEQK